MTKRYEVKDVQGNIISARASIQFARSDANKNDDATIWEVIQTYAEGKKAYAFKFCVE